MCKDVFVENWIWRKKRVCVYYSVFLKKIEKIMFVMFEHVFIKPFFKKVITIWGMRDWGIYNWDMRDGHI